MMPPFKQDQAFIQGLALFLIAYFEGTVDLQCSVIAVHLHGLNLSSSSQRPPTKAAMHLCSENTSCEAVGLSTSI